MQTQVKVPTQRLSNRSDKYPWIWLPQQVAIYRQPLYPVGSLCHGADMYE